MKEKRRRKRNKIWKYRKCEEGEKRNEKKGGGRIRRSDGE